MPKWRADSERIQIAGCTHAGRGRTGNEDSFLAVKLPGAADALLAVADGVGGRDAGDIASQLAVQMLLRERLRLGSVCDGGAKTCRRHLLAAIQSANLFLFKLNRQFGGSPFATGTTLTVLHILPEQGTVFSIGDSRCYRLRHDRLTVLTHDDTWAQHLADQKQLKAGDVDRHPLANTLFRCLGSYPTLNEGFSSIGCLHHDRFLLCTDGVWKMLNDEQVKLALADSQSPTEAVDRLIRGALREGGRDNLAACAAFLP